MRIAGERSTHARTHRIMHSPRLRSALAARRSRWKIYRRSLAAGNGWIREEIARLGSGSPTSPFVLYLWRSERQPICNLLMGMLPRVPFVSMASDPFRWMMHQSRFSYLYLSHGAEEWLRCRRVWIAPICTGFGKLIAFVDSILLFSAPFPLNSDMPDARVAFWVLARRAELGTPRFIWKYLLLQFNDFSLFFFQAKQFLTHRDYFF